MNNPESALPHYNSIGDWVSKYRVIFSPDGQLGYRTPDEVKRVAKELGVTTSELNRSRGKGLTLQATRATIG